MKARILMWSAVFVTICASSAFAARTWHVSHDSVVSFRIAIPAGGAALLAIAAVISSKRRRLGRGVVLAVVGALFVLAVTIFEATTGLAEVVLLAPDETVDLGTAKVTLRGFEASFQESGELTGCRSDLLLDFSDGSDSIVVATDSPSVLRGLFVSQLGLEVTSDSVGRKVYSKVGLLRGNGGWPFLGGLAVFSLGSVFALLPSNSRRAAA